MSASKPMPLFDNWNSPFWAACKENRLMLQRCGTTRQCWYPPAPVSPYDPGAQWEWVECSGLGKIVSWTVFHHNYFAGFAGDIPYNVTLVQLDEGATLLTNIKNGNDKLAKHARVKVVFENRGEVTVPVFEVTGEHL